MKRYFNTLISLVVFCFSLNATATCLDDAANYAERICGELNSTGSSTFVDASGQLTAEANSIIKRVLGSVGGSVDIKVLKSKYQNVLREHLPSELKNARSCRERMEAVARGEVCKKPTVYKSCRDPSFGIEKWGSTEDIQDATGWRDGWTQDAFCNQLINSSIAARNIGGQQHRSEILNKWEKGKWGNATFRTNRQYRYHCIIRLFYNPIFKQRRDPICGVESS